jgi:hypothetical protein
VQANGIDLDELQYESSRNTFETVGGDLGRSSQNAARSPNLELVDAARRSQRLVMSPGMIPDRFILF